jgi:hypothetical protein
MALHRLLPCDFSTGGGAGALASIAGECRGLRGTAELQMD